MNFYKHTKNWFISFIFPWHTASFRPLRTEWPHPFLIMLTLIFFGKLLFSMNLYQDAKNQAFSLFCSTDTVEIQPRAFWSISQEPGFSLIWDLCKNTENSINFHYRPISKTMIKFSSKFKKLYFLPIFPISWATRIFSKNLSVRRNKKWALNTMLSFRKY